jgi:hypothetical protein
MILAPSCYKRSCKHFRGVKNDGDDESGERVICAAFPDGIPDEIAFGDNLHKTPLDGQGNEIVFEVGRMDELP